MYLRAVFLFHFPTFHAFVATVAAIPTTAFVVVIVVAVAVSAVVDVLARCRRLTEIIGVHALALQSSIAHCPQYQ